ncbi:site-specific integrase [uncultured Paraglaciecola sp.]|uniref:tyrosine-type recombinase/integrase n=1 Tax=uncultured Paraglaciecola sp. TaxID=1765024 RepID=UPI00260E7AE3|nr:site-specific integrase [uncultured Paraglaciecola sp.]
MSKQIDRHNIDDTLYVYLQNNSKYWYCRFVIFGKWYAKATKETDVQKAIAKAHRIKLEYEVRVETNTLFTSKRFCDVAEKAIQNMHGELIHGGGKVIYKDYIGALRKYFIPFFERTFITSIDQDKILEFEAWRIDQLKRVPAKSTILTHNAALQMVFKEAIDKQWMLPVQVPVLSNKEVAGQRRASLSKKEYDKAYDSVIKLEQNSRTEKSRQIRELLLDYMEFAVNTGIRPGTEMESITWADIHMERNDHNVVFFVTITKGKTTKYTGTREIVCRDEIFGCLEELRERFPNRKPSDKLFRLADGSTTNELGEAFDKALNEVGLKQSPHGVRILYSLRHTYITWQLMSGEVNMEILAKQCGTSVQMIEQHYSHVIPKMFTKELSGVDIGRSKPQKKKRSPEVIAKSQARLTKRFKEWEAEYKKRGCI